MAQVIVTRSYDVAPDPLWERIGGFQTFDSWHPAIASCEPVDGDQKRRLLTTVDGAEIFETLTETGEHSYTYTIDESPLPVTDYTASMAVTPEGEGSTVTWRADFTAAGASDAEAEAVIEGIFAAGLDAL